jgi:prepilin-type N-terminal cleavage/methylation domain-containing protein
VSNEIRAQSGFTLVELAIVVTVMSIMLAFGVASYSRLSQSQQGKGVSEAIAQQVILARTRAMATGRTQTLNFDTGTTPNRVVALDGTSSRTWTLPRGVHFASGSATTLALANDGRASASQYIVVQNQLGHVDTVSVQTSGFVLVR